LTANILAVIEFGLPQSIKFTDSKTLKSDLRLAQSVVCALLAKAKLAF
jgi:hypothetical protein